MFTTETLAWEELIVGLQGRIIQGSPDHPATGISTDTRTLTGGELFVALEGPNFNGRDYVLQAFGKGAAAALVSAPLKRETFPAGKLVIQVENTLTALGDLASLWRRKFPVILIGISGSNGKTTTKEMLTAILQLEGPTLKNPGNLNNWIGLPLSLFALNKDHRYAVMEMGMNHLGEITRLCQIARPNAGLLTSIGPAHLEGLGSLEAVAQAKGELFESLDPSNLAVINVDDSLILERSRNCRARKMTFGLDSSAMVTADRVSLTSQGISFRILFRGEEEHLFIPILGEHNISNALGAAATALAFGLSLSKVREGLNGFNLPEHRLQFRKGIKGIQLIDDTYNANPASFKAALSSFEFYRQGQRGGLVLGDMFELGDQSQAAHREIGGIIGGMGIAYLMVIGPLSKEISEEAEKGSRPPQRVFWAQNQEELIEALHQVIRKDDILLVKGSHGMKMELIVEALEDRE